MVEFTLRDIDEELRRRYVSAGFWTDENLGEVLADKLTSARSNDFAVHSELRPWAGTFGDVLGLAKRVAGGLRALGIGPGDLVAMQFPNWIEGCISFYAAAWLGAVPVPIVHFYGPKEVGFILRQSGARVLLTADAFGPLDFVGNLTGIRDSLPDLETIVVAGEPREGTVAFDRLLEADPVEQPSRVDPARPALIAYTSGTTSEPKGVIHTHRSIVAEVKQLSAVQPDEAPPSLVGAPIGHGIGMLAALLIPVINGDPVHLIDVWDPSTVLRTMREHRLLSGTGATFFLMSLLDHPDLGEEHLRLMRFVGLGGSAVPTAVGERAAQLGISTVRLYGSTEHPSTTGCTHDDPPDKRIHTDGRPLPGVEMELEDLDGDRAAEPGEPGEILSRGPDCFAGYTDPELTREAFTSDGYYRTGDVGVLDEDGYLSITDRIKDIIIRGGENVSAAEVEDQLLRLPGVAEVAVVAAPDQRLGEHACAVFRLQPDASEIELEGLRAHLAAVGMAKQKWPEEIQHVADFPRTPSGKIQKFKLRAELRAQAGT